MPSKSLRGPKPRTTKDGKVQVMLMLQPEIRAALRAHAQLNEDTMSNVAAQALNSYLFPVCPAPTPKQGLRSKLKDLFS